MQQGTDELTHKYDELISLEVDYTAIKARVRAASQKDIATSIVRTRAYPLSHTLVRKCPCDHRIPFQLVKRAGLFLLCSLILSLVVLLPIYYVILSQDRDAARIYAGCILLPLVPWLFWLLYILVSRRQMVTVRTERYTESDLGDSVEALMPSKEEFRSAIQDLHNAYVEKYLADMCERIVQRRLEIAVDEQQEPLINAVERITHNREYEEDSE
jgi:hypothetical protein